MVTFNIVTQAVFDGMASKDGDAIYFVTDTRRIYRGSVRYTGEVRMVSSFPTTGEVGVLYIANANLEGRVWQNGDWVVVAKGYTTTISSDSADVPTSQAVAAYVTNAITEAIGSSSVITGITYEAEDAADSGTGNDERDLVVTKSDGSTQRLHLSNLVTSVEYDQSNLTLTFRLSCVDDPIVVNLPQDNFITGGYYDTATKEIVLNMKDGSTIRIPAADLVDVYTGAETATISVSVSSGNVITANSRLSATANNILSANADGLYVPAPTGKMDKVASSGAGQILVADSGGNASASGRTAGGAALSSTPSENVLATEAAVAAVRSGIQTTIAAIQTSLESKVDTASITTTLNASNPSASKIPSESAVVAALTWRNLTV